MLEFSVIVPTYNRLDELQRCLTPLTPERQGIAIERYEVIVTDDQASEGNRDAVAQVLQNLTYTPGPGKGPAGNRNHGARLAKGEWLVFTDDDCIPSTGWLGAFAEAVRPNCSVYEGKTTCAAGVRSALESAPGNLTGGYLWSCNFMIRRDLFFSIGSFDEAFPYAAMEDVDLRERLKAAGHTIPFVPAAIVDHPPRRIQGLGELEKAHLSFAYYTVVKRGERLSLRGLLYSTLRTRVRRIVRAPQRKDSIEALVLLAREVLMILTSARRWQRHCERLKRI